MIHNKFLHKLTREDLTNLMKYTFEMGDDSDFHISFERSSGFVIFSYTVDGVEFSIPFANDFPQAALPEDAAARFSEWMLNRFGIDYMIDYFSEENGIDKKSIEKVCGIHSDIDFQRERVFRYYYSHATRIEDVNYNGRPCKMALYIFKRDGDGIKGIISVIPLNGDLLDFKNALTFSAFHDDGRYGFKELLKRYEKQADS